MMILRMGCLLFATVGLPLAVTAEETKEYTCEEVIEHAKEGWRRHAQARERISYDYTFSYSLPEDLGQQFAERRQRLAEEERRFWGYENTTATGQVVKGQTCFDYSWRIAAEDGEVISAGWFSDERDPLDQIGMNPETGLVSYRFGDFFEAMEREAESRECRQMSTDSGEVVVLWLHYQQEESGQPVTESFHFAHEKDWLLKRHELLRKGNEGEPDFHVQTDFTIKEIDGVNLMTGYEFTLPTRLWKRAYGREKLTLENVTLSAECP